MTGLGAARFRPAPYAVVLAIAAAIHLALLAYFIPRRLVFSGSPILGFDFALHAYQVDRALAAMQTTGHLWSYDPLVLAGHPAGALEDLTSKSLELFVILAARLGMSPWRAFNTYVLLVHLAMPLVAWKAARLFDLSRLAAAVTVLLWVLVWHFDSFLHWCWYIGMISWSASSYLIVLVVALMHRALRDHRGLTYVGLGVTAALVTLVHPFSVLTLLAPLAGLYARAFPRARAWEHLALVACTALVAATTLAWIGPALRFRHYIGSVDAFLWPTLSYIALDWLDLLKDLLMTGQPVRTALRTLAFVLCAVGLLRFWKARDGRLLPLGLLVGVSFAQAYLGGYSSALRQTQPYRHIAPATLAAALVAAAVVVEVFSRRELLRLDRDARTAVLVLTLVAVPQLARTALGYLPTLLPKREHPRSALQVGPAPGMSSEEADLLIMGYAGAPPEYRALAEHLSRTVGTRGRVAVVNWVLSEYIAAFTRVPTLGGIPQRFTPHVAAHPARHDFRPESKEDDTLKRYLAEYAVAAVVTSGDHGLLDQRHDLLELVEGIGEHRIYRVREEPSYFAAGSGRVVEQRLNSIRIADAAGEEVILRFHWLETLRCRPSCTVERAAADRDPAGFIRVRRPPRAFEIFNAYD